MSYRIAPTHSLPRTGGLAKETNLKSNQQRQMAMADKTDRRCFLARGILGAAGIGAAYGSIEEKILLAAIQDGVAQTSRARRKSLKPIFRPAACRAARSATCRSAGCSSAAT